MGSGGVEWTLDPPTGTAFTVGAQPKAGESREAFSYDTPFGNYTFSRDAPHRLRLLASAGEVVTAWFQPMLPTDAAEGTSKVVSREDTMFVTEHEVVVEGVSVASVRTTFEFFPDHSPKASATLTPLVDLGDPQLAWILLTNATTVHYGTSFAVDFGNETNLLPLEDPESRIEVGEKEMIDGEEPSARIDWSDAPPGTSAYGGRLKTVLGDFGGVLVIFPAGATEVDPTVFATSTSSTATGYSSQRKVLWNGERHWVFYDTGSAVVYRTTPDGLSWSDARTVVTGSPGMGFDVDSRGPTVALAWYSGYTLKFRKGTFYTDTIAWDADQSITSAYPLDPPLPSVAVAADGSYWAAGHVVYRSVDGVTWVDKTTTNWSANVGVTSATFVLPLSGTRGSTTLSGWLYAILNYQPFPSYNELLVGLYNVSGSGSWTEHVFDINQWYAPRHDTISALITGEAVALLYTNAPDHGSTGDVLFRQIGFVGSGFDFGISYDWPVALSEFAPYYPSLAIGPPGNFFAFWRSKVQGEWVVRNSTGDGTYWGAPSSMFPVSPGQNPTWLTTPRVFLNRAVLAWREAGGSCSACNLTFGAIPLTDDFGASYFHPWARAGLSVGTPLIGELSDGVNPASGQLIVRQADTGAAGRGLDLTLTRIHTSPHAFVSGQPLFYATNPTVPMGVGWEIGLPWVEWNVNAYLHLGDGQKYVIVWNGSKFENRVGTPFTLYNNLHWPCAGGYDLYLADGTRLNFTLAPGCDRTNLNYIVDLTGQNQITVTYASNKLVGITDTLGRTASFAYYPNGTTCSGCLQTLSYAGRSVTFEYTTGPGGGAVLWRVTYPRGLQTTYDYDASGGFPGDYLIKAVHQPSVNPSWGASTSYTYAAAPVGTEATGYFVTQQDIKDNATLVRRRTFTYALVNGWATSTNITVGDGVVSKGYQVLGFASATRGMTVLLKDASGKQLSKSVAWYTPTGSFGATDVYLGDAANRNFTNVVAVDDWGNPYCTLTALNASVSHETFASFGNANSGNAFRAPAVARMTTDGKIQQETFERLDLLPWTLTATGGTVALNYTVWDRAPPSMRLYRSSVGTVSARRSFPAQSAAFLFTTSIRVGEINKDHRMFLEQGATVRVELSFASDGTVKWKKSDGTYATLQTYEANAWYRVSLKLNMASNATISINENRYAAGNTVYAAGTVDGVRYDLPSSTSTMFVGGYGLARLGTGPSPYLSFRLTGLVAGRKVELLDPTDAVVWSGTADGSGNVDVGNRHQLVPAGSLKVYDGNGKEEYRSPFREFWPGSAYGYTAPYAFPNGKFYASTLPADVHNAVLGILEWQTGRGAANPVVQESYGKYLSNGLLNATKVYHNGVALETTYTVDADGNVILVKDVQGKVVRYDYGVAYSSAWLTRERRALSGSEVTSRATYDFATGLQNSTTNPRGYMTRALYDELGRPIEVRSFDAEPSTEVLFYDMETLTADVTPKQQDLSGKGNHGTLLDTAPSGGKVDRARYFDGVNDMISAPDSSSLSLTSSFTIAAWVRYDSLSGTSTRVVARKYDASTNKGYALEVYETGAGANAKKLRLLIGSGAQNSYASTGTLPNSLTWYHVAAVFNDTANTVRFYINGAQSGLTTSVNVAPSDNSLSLAVGRRYDTVTMMWKGTLDEVRVFNAALSASDISALVGLTYRLYASRLVSYDDAARRITTTDEDGRRTRETFDTLGRRTKVERLDSLGAAYSTEVFGYNWQDLLVAYTSPTGNVTTRLYDVLGRVTKETHPDANWTLVSYTDVALYTKVTEPNGNAKASHRDFGGRLVKVQELGPPLAVATNGYDEIGNLVRVTNARDQATTHTYDDLNRLTKTTYPDGLWESFSYHDAGALWVHVFRNGSQASYIYDDLYRLTFANYPGTASDITHAYDANGNPTWANNSVAKVSYEYDLKDRTAKERVEFLGGGPIVTTVYTYTKAGDVSTLAYPGAAFTLSYETDEFHRVKRAYNGATNYVQFTYLTDDAIQAATFGNGLTTSAVFDKRSRPASITTKDGATEVWSFRYGYDKSGNVLSLSGTGIPTQTFTYDPYGRIASSTGTPWGDLTYWYDAVGNRQARNASAVLRPNGPGSPTQWGRVGCTANWQCVDEGPYADGDSTYVTSSVHGESDEYALQDLPPGGTIASVTVTAVANDLPLDPCVPPGSCPFYLQLTVNGYTSPLKLLASFAYQAYSHTWTTNPATGAAWNVSQVNALEAGVRKYDLNAGVDSETRVTQLYVSVAIASTTYAYNDGPTGMNELLSTSGAETASFTYTTNGELATKTEGGVTWTYAYNEMGLLASVKQGATTVAQYSYDGLGRRVKTVEGSTTTYFVYGLGIDPIWEKSGTTETRHVYANGMRTARMVVGGATYYYHADALGSTWRITDTAKATVFSTNYEPFGRSWGTAGSLAASERYRFLGERNDTESGFTYLRARQYDPSTGRFTAMDPVLGALGMPQTLNRYPYVVNNPTRYTDPTGEFLWILFLFVYGISLASAVTFLVTGSVDAAMVAIGIIPILGDIVSTAYFLTKDLLACMQDRGEEEEDGCSPGMIGLDALGFLPLVPALGAAAHVGKAGRAANRADPLFDALRRGGRFDPPGGIRTIGPGQDIPLHGPPFSITRGIGQSNDLRKLGIYDEFGNLRRRIDVAGRPHGGVPPPHVTEYTWTAHPLAPGGWGHGKVFRGPTYSWEDELIAFYR